MEKGDQLVIIREVDTDPQTSDLTRMVAGFLTLGIALDEDCPYQETREMIGDHEQRVVTWVFKARSRCGKYDTHAMVGAWNDPDFASKSPEHPLAYIRSAFTNLSRTLAFVAGQAPLALIHKGKRMALISMDAPLERREELLAALNQ